MPAEYVVLTILFKCCSYICDANLESDGWHNMHIVSTKSFIVYIDHYVVLSTAVHLVC